MWYCNSNSITNYPREMQHNLVQVCGPRCMWLASALHCVVWFGFGATQAQHLVFVGNCIMLLVLNIGSCSGIAANMLVICCGPFFSFLSRGEMTFHAWLPRFKDLLERVPAEDLVNLKATEAKYLGRFAVLKASLPRTAILITSNQSKTFQAQKQMLAAGRVSKLRGGAFPGLSCGNQIQPMPSVCVCIVALRVAVVNCQHKVFTTFGRDG